MSLDQDDAVARRPIPSPDSRYITTLETLGQAITALHARLHSARTAERHLRPDILYDLHHRVRGMSRHLNAALGELVQTGVPSEPQRTDGPPTTSLSTKEIHACEEGRPHDR